MMQTTKLDDFESRNERVAGIIDNWLPWFVGASLALTSQWAAPAIQRLIEEGQHPMFVYDIAYIVVFICFLIWFAQLVKKHFKARTKEMRVIDDPSHCPYLILFLSTTKNSIPKELKNKGLKSLAGDLDKLVELKQEQSVFWSWEMPLRSISYHVKNPEKPILKEIIVICSNESLKQYEAFQEILNGYLRNTLIKVRLLRRNERNETVLSEYNSDQGNLKGINFEDFDELSTHLYKAIKLLNKQRIEQKDIMVDITGGQKVTSVVAATLTFNSEINAQYISTQTLRVKGYDIIYGTKQIPDFG